MVNATHYDAAEDANRTIWREYHTEIPQGYVVIPILLLVLTLVNNTLIVLTFKRVKTKQFTDIFMAGLAVADFIMSIPLSVTVVILIRGFINMSVFLCDFWALVFVGGLSTTMWLHCAICIEKCVSITRPLEHRLFLQKEYSHRIAYAVIVVCICFPDGYLIALVYSGVLTHADFDPHAVFCLYDVNMKFLFTAGNLFLTSSLIVELVTNSLILHQVLKSTIQRKKRILRTIRTVLITLGAYYLCTGPVAVGMVWRTTADKPPPPGLRFAGCYFLLSNNCVNFFIYLSSMPRFREAFMKMTGYHPQKATNRIHVLRAQGI